MSFESRRRFAVLSDLRQLLILLLLLDLLLNQLKNIHPRAIKFTILTLLFSLINVLLEILPLTEWKTFHWRLSLLSI